MAKKEETKEWKASKKFYPKTQYEVLKFKLFDEVKVVSEKKGIEVLSPAQFITVTRAGYTPCTKEEEDRLIALALDPKTDLIEEAQLPATAASARDLKVKLVDKEQENKKLREELEEYKKMMAAAGLKVEE